MLRNTQGDVYLFVYLRTKLLKEAFPIIRQDYAWKIVLPDLITFQTIPHVDACFSVLVAL